MARDSFKHIIDFWFHDMKWYIKIGVKYNFCCMQYIMFSIIEIYFTNLSNNTNSFSTWLPSQHFTAQCAILFVYMMSHH